MSPTASTTNKSSFFWGKHTPARTFVVVSTPYLHWKVDVEPEPTNRITKKSPLIHKKPEVVGNAEFVENPEAEIPVPVENPDAEMPVPVENPDQNIPVPVEDPDQNMTVPEATTQEVVVDGWGMYEMDGLLLSEDEPDAMQPDLEECPM